MANQRTPISTTPALSKNSVIHDWYLLPESYSAPLVHDAIAEFGLNPGDTVLDPFAGAGTTLVASAFKEVQSVGLEINPFLAFAARVKLRWDVNLVSVAAAWRRLIDRTATRFKDLSLPSGVREHPAKWRSTLRQASLFDEVQMPRLYRWISPRVVQKVLTLKEEIKKVRNSAARDLFFLALAAILRPCSNMKLTPHAFGSRQPKEDAPVLEYFLQKGEKILRDLKEIGRRKIKPPRTEVINVDARYSRGLKSELLPAQLAITSPPYLNNLDYTMQTRLELFFLDFVRDMDELRKLRKEMVISDAKAMYKDVPDTERVAAFDSIQSIARRLRQKHQGKNWGWDYSYMTTQYFGGIHRVLECVLSLLSPGARFILIVGESAHSGIKVPVPAIIGELGTDIGYRLEEIRVHRSRRSSSHKFELNESAVILRKPS